MESLVKRGLALAERALRERVLSPERHQLIRHYYFAEGRVRPAEPRRVLRLLGRVPESWFLAIEGASGPVRRSGPAAGESLAGRFEIVAPLGEGGMGAVYRAHDRVLGREVALKVLRPERMGDPATLERSLARFEREVRVMARVRHPACVQVHDAGTAEDGRPYLVMEYVAGQTLAQALEATPAGLEARQVARWGEQLADALHSCHEFGVVHRDIKPANILLGRDGQVRLADFGIALDVQARTQLTARRGAIGTLSYMAPEQLAGERVDGRADVYSLGATLYEALCGRPPFEGEQPLLLVRRILSGEPEPPTAIRPELPRDLESVLLRCLERDPGARYQSGQALALDLARFLADESVSARPSTPWTRVWRGARRRRRPIAAGALLTLLIAAGVGAGRLIFASRARSRALEELAMLSRAGDVETLAAAEALCLRHRAGTDSVVAEAAEAALRTTRGRQLLIEARGRLDRFRQLGERVSALTDEIEVLDQQITMSTVPFEESPDKQRLLRAGEERTLLLREREFERETLLQVLGRARGLAPENEAARLEAAAYLTVARERAQDDPDEAEAWFAQALECQRRAPAPELEAHLRPARVSVRALTPGAQGRLSRYVKDHGRFRESPLGEFHGAARWELEAGDYVVELQSADHLPQRVPFRVSRGEERVIETGLVPESSLGPLAEEFVSIPAGTLHRRYSRYGRRIEPFLVGRTEVRVEQWRSFVIDRGLGGDALPQAFANPEWVVRNRSRFPICGVSDALFRDFLAWLQEQVTSMNLPLRARLPGRQDYLWALRAEFNWTYSWGNHFDGSFALLAGARGEGALQSVGSAAVDVSPFGVFDLVGSVNELCETPDGLHAFGGSVAEVKETALPLITGTLGPRDLEGNDFTGLRVLFELVPGAQPPANGESDRRLDPELSRRIDEHLRAGDLTAANALLNEAVRTCGRDPRAWARRAWLRSRRGDRWGAYLDSAFSLSLDPEQAAMLTLRGSYYYAGDRLDEARADFEAAVRLEPGRADTWEGLGRTRYEQGDFRGAVVALQRYLAAAPADQPQRAEVEGLLAEAHRLARADEAEPR